MAEIDRIERMIVNEEHALVTYRSLHPMQNRNAHRQTVLQQPLSESGFVTETTSTNSQAFNSTCRPYVRPSVRPYTSAYRRGAVNGRTNARTNERTVRPRSDNLVTTAVHAGHDDSAGKRRAGFTELGLAMQRLQCRVQFFGRYGVGKTPTSSDNR